MRRFSLIAASKLLDKRRVGAPVLVSPTPTSDAPQLRLVTGRSAPLFYVTDEKAFEAALKSLVTKDIYVNGKKALAQQRVESLQKEIATMTPIKEAIDAKVLRSSTSFLFANLTFLTVQFAVLFQWVFFTFDWNLVEPVTYFLGYTVVWAGLVFYCQTGRSFTYDDIVSVLEERRRTKLCAKMKFDYDKYVALVEELEKAKEELQHY
jgi:hypothetical protein